MEHYDNRGTPEAFARSVSAFDLLTATLSDQTAGAWTHAELEEHLRGAGRALMRQLLQDHLDLRAIREEEHLRARPDLRVTGPDGHTRPWRERGHERWLSTVFGHVRVGRVAHRGPGVSNVHPADVLLSLPAGRHSMGLRRQVVTEAVRGSFGQALAAVGRQCGTVVGKRRLEELVVEAATDIDGFYRASIPLPCSRDMPLVIQADGKGVVMRPDGLREATRRKAAQAAAQGRRSRLAPGEKPNRQRIATIACLFDTRPAPRRPHDVIGPPEGRSGHRTRRPRPKRAGPSRPARSKALPAPDRRPPRHQRRPLGPARRQSRPQTPRRDQQRRPRRLLGLPRRPRTRTALPPTLTRPYSD